MKLDEVLARATDIRHGTDQWREARSKLLTGTDAGAILGVSKWRTPLDVWSKLVLGQSDSLEDNSYLRWGRIMEPIAAAEFANVTGMQVHLTDRFWISEDGIMGGSPDGFVTDPMADGVGVIEIKAPSAYTADEWDEGVCPEHYRAQLIHYLVVTGAKWGVLCALLPPRSRDSELIATIHVGLTDAERASYTAKVRAWHDRHVKRQVQPDAIARDVDHLRRKYSEAAVRTELVDVELMDEYLASTANEKVAKEAAGDAKARLLQALGEAMFGVDEDGRAVTWKPRADGRRVLRAAKALPKDAPAPESAA